MYLGYQNGKIKFYTEQPLQAEFYNLDKVEETDLEYVLDGEEYVLKDEAWENKQAQKEKDRISNLSMTRGDLFEALILAQGKGKSELRAMIESYPGLTDIQRALYLNRFDEALDFYRKHPAIDLVGGMLGISSENMDKFFDTKDYTYLKVAPIEPDSGEDSEPTIDDGTSEEVVNGEEPETTLDSSDPEENPI